MNFADQIARIQSASSDPKKVALAVLDILLASHPPELRRVLEAAAVLRWFDRASLEPLLDEDLRGRAAHWLEQLKTLTAVEPASGRDAWNVHESTRRALREQLQTERPGRLVEIARRAILWFRGSDASVRIEHAYHLAIADPESCGPALRALHYDLQAHPEQSLAFAGALGEYLTHEAWPYVTRGWAAYFGAVSRHAFRPLQGSIADAELARLSFESANDVVGLACSLAILGGLLLERAQTGDADQALEHFQRSLDLRERLLADNPQSAQAARDVSVSLERLGDFLARRGQAGDAERALEHYERGLEVRDRLLAGNPKSAEAARDVSVSLERLGDFLEDRGQGGDAERVLGHYERSLELREGLLADNPQSAQAARDVSASLVRLGDVLEAGDAERALGYYQRSLELCERLLADNPQSAQAVRDVSVSLNKLGGFLAGRGQAGDSERALGYYQRSLELRERLLAENSQSAQTARDVSASLVRLGDFLARQGRAGDAERALGHYERSLELRERLLAGNPHSAQAARDLLVTLERMASFESERAGGEVKAMDLQLRALAIAVRLRDGNPQSLFYGRTAAVSFFLAGQLAHVAKKEELARQCHSGCLRVLDELLAAGCYLDPDLANMRTQLKPLFQQES